MERSETIGKLTAAMSNLQGDLRDAVKDSEGRFNYASLGAILEIARPLLKIHRLTVMQPAEDPPAGIDGVTIVTLLSHESDEYIMTKLTIPLDPKASMNDTQKRGSAISYARRYCLAAVLGIAQIDDDAESLENKPAVKTPKQWDRKQENKPEEPTIGQERAMALMELIAEAKLDLQSTINHYKTKFPNRFTDDLSKLPESLCVTLENIMKARIEKNKEGAE